MATKAVGETDNLTELENLNEQSLLAELQMRYKRNVIYTYVGEILVAVNPFKKIEGIYDKSKMVEYDHVGDRNSRPPHIFAVSDSAFTSMCANPPGRLANQVCVISGESGAGKTESAKLFVKQVIYLSSKGAASTEGGGLEDKIVQLNPLLEAFGNAQTLMNDNSSRFGKFIELRFNASHTVTGVLMYEYLLEKSRVVQQGPGEQNFHVFYLFFSGITSANKDKFQVGDPSEYRFINGNSSAMAKIQSQLFKDMYKELVDCMTIVGFNEEEVDDIFHALAGILFVGDIEFGGDEQSNITSAADILERACNQLGVETEAMKEALQTSVTITRGETIVRPYRPSESEDVRDATAKALYGRCFTYIVRKCNDLLGPKDKKLGPDEKTIGILDIFGFECFKDNSLEQLLINLANEQLQFFFNNHIFKMELDEYAREGIDGSKISFEDNQPLLDMMLSKPVGLLSICDEEALFPKSTDTSLIEKLHQNLTVHAKLYERPKGNANIFTINHYAGKVTYKAEGFLEKNRDTLAMDVVSAFRLSENTLVRTLFGADEEDMKAAKKAAKTKAKAGAADVKKKLRQSMKKVAKEQAKTKKTTVGAEFKISLEELMTEMSGAAPHFVRCLKPNMSKIPDTYDGELVTKQLRYTGMLETTRIRKEGYAYRPTFGDFVERYKLLGFGVSSTPPPTDATCARILAKASVEGYQVGKTKVFLRYFHVDLLNDLLRPFPNAATCLQKVARGMAARKKFARAKEQAAKEKALVDSMFTKVEKSCADMATVMQSLGEEDAARPNDYWKKSALDETTDPNFKKFAKSIKKQIKKEGGISRAASVRWFKEVEMKKGAGMKSGNFEEWFHGVITRKDAEELLRGTAAGTFLVRVAESRFGYSLSHCIESTGRIKHYMIDQTPDGQYQVVGNRKLFPSLNELVQYHYDHKIVATDPVALVASCGQRGEHNDTEEFMQQDDKKKKK